MSDPADLAPSRDPAAYGKRPLFTAGFFAWVSLCVICLLAGAAIGRFGAPGQSPAAPVTPAAATAPGNSAAPPATPAPVPGASPPGQPDQVVADRLARLESSSAHTSDAAVDALAAASLSVAAESSGPFDQDLAAYERLAPDDPDLAALRPLAAQGAPSRAALVAALPALADRAALAARAPADDASLLAKALALISKAVIVRSTDPNAGGVDGALARAEDQTAGGDFTAAVRTLQRLPPKARAPLDDWIAAVGRRSEIDRRVASLRVRALAALAAPAPAGAPP